MNRPFNKGSFPFHVSGSDFNVGRIFFNMGSLSFNVPGSVAGKEEDWMDRAFGLDIPLTLEEVCDPRRMALIVYDMQVGIAGQLPHGPEITAWVGEVLSAAREGASARSSVATRRCPSS